MAMVSITCAMWFGISKTERGEGREVLLAVILLGVGKEVSNWLLCIAVTEFGWIVTVLKRKGRDMFLRYLEHWDRDSISFTVRYGGIISSQSSGGKGDVVPAGFRCLSLG